MTDAPTDVGLAEPSSMDEVDCPGCDAGPERFHETIVEAGGEWWHSVCLLEAHPQVEHRDAKRCPECGVESEYRPLTCGPRARSCPRCLTVYPGWVEIRDGVQVVEPPFDDVDDVDDSSADLESDRDAARGGGGDSE